MGDILKNYYARLIDKTLKEYLQIFGAVLIEGPKWCGKTTTASKQSNSVLKMQDSRQGINYVKVADFSPSLLLDGDNPRLIDEWQMAPILWDAIRTEVDERGEPGLYILTGSVTPPKESTMHSGTGRIARLLMRTMSLYESQDSTGSISMQSLFLGKLNIQAKSNLSVSDIAYLICRGGWPQSIGTNRPAALAIAKQYVMSLYSNGFSKEIGISKDPKRMQAVLKSYARNIQTLAKNTTLLEDIKSKDIEISEATLYSYLNLLEALFVIEETPAWAPKVRSKTAQRVSNKKGFIDPSIPAAVLGLTPDTLLQDFETFGFLFESMCIRDLRLYAQQIDGEIYHYRDQYGLECDAVIRLNNGKYALVEIKLGIKAEELGAKNLNKLETLLSENGHEKPIFKMILTGGEFAYTRQDGVIVVPLGCLGI